MCSGRFNESAGFSMKQKTQHEDCQDILIWKKLWCDMSECLFSIFFNVVNVLHPRQQLSGQQSESSLPDSED